MNSLHCFLKIIAFLLGCSISSASAQQYLWHFDLQSTNRSVLYTDIAVDASDNVYLVGASFEDIDLDPGPGTTLFSIANPSNSHADVYIAKYDTAQQLLWHISLAGISPTLNAITPAWIELDGDSAFYFAATFRGAADFDPGPDTALIAWSNTASIFNVGDLVIARYGTDGSFRWAHTMGSERSDLLEDVRVDSAGKLVISISSSATLDIDPGPNVIPTNQDSNGTIFTNIIKYDQQGAYLNHFSLPTGASANGIFINPANELYVSGSFRDSVDIDPGPQTHWLLPVDSASQYGFVAKYSPDYSLLWANYMVGGNPHDVPSGLGIDANDNVYVFCLVDDLVDIRPDSVVQIVGQEGIEELILVKFDSIGQFAWVNYFPSWEFSDNYPYNLVVGPGGDVFITGTFYGSKLDLDPSADSLIIVNPYEDNYFYNESFLAAYRRDGTVKWGFGLALSSESSQVEALFLKDRTLYWAGTYNPAIQFAPGVIDSSTGSTPFVVAYRVDAKSPPIGTTSLDPVSFQALSLYPNPAETAIHFSTEGLKGVLGIQVMNMQGALIYHQFQYAEGEHVLSVKNFPSGMYVIRVQEVTGKKILQGRFVKP